MEYIMSKRKISFRRFANVLTEKNNSGSVIMMSLLFIGIMKHSSAFASIDKAENNEKNDNVDIGNDVLTVQVDEALAADLNNFVDSVTAHDESVAKFIRDYMKIVIADSSSASDITPDYLITDTGSIKYYHEGHFYEISGEITQAVHDYVEYLMSDAETGLSDNAYQSMVSLAAYEAAGSSAGSSVATASAITGTQILAASALAVVAGVGVAVASGGGDSGGSSDSPKQNEAPTAVSLSDNTVAENSAGAVIGALSTTDADAGDTFTYTVSDNRFEVVNGNLKLVSGTSLNYETEPTVSVTVTSTDSGGLTKSQAFTVNVANVNDAPSAVSLSANTVAENSAGAVIGALSTTDADAGDTFTYSVSDNRFEVVNGNLKLISGTSLNYETEPTVSVTVTSTDSGGLTKSQAFTVNVTNLTENIFVTGTVGDDNYDYSTLLNNYTIIGLAGDDTILTDGGRDLIRPGEGADIVDTGSGDDTVVLVGTTGVNQYSSSDITNPGGTTLNLSGVLSLADLNNRSVSEAAVGEQLNGGAGTNTLVIYGNVDMTGMNVAGFQQILVNSTLTMTAQQFNSMGISFIKGDGESTLVITNDTGSPITVDLSGIDFSEFKTLNIGSDVTVVADQSDVQSLRYITGEGSLQASQNDGGLDLSGKLISTQVLNSTGVVDDGSVHNGTVVSGDIIIGTEGNDTLTGSDLGDRIEGGAGNDTIIGGSGNDIIRGGGGVDTMEGGDGDDIFVVVGDLSTGGKVDSAQDTEVLGEQLTNYNGMDFNEDESGSVEIIRGGDGNDTLYVYGTADISNYILDSIENIEIRSDVIFSAGQLSVISGLTGDGSSTIRIVNTGDTPMDIDLTQLNLSYIGQIDVGDNVNLKISSLDDLGGARILTGSGSFEALNGSISLPNTFTVQSGLQFNQIDSTQAVNLENVVHNHGDITGGAGDDYLIGSDYSDKFNGTSGDDVYVGNKGDDTFLITDVGDKIILDNGGVDTLDLSRLASGADINLKSGGTVGNDISIQLGAGNTLGAIGQIASNFNIMIIMDTSGSMSGTRLIQAKQAAIALLDAYDELGNVSVKLVRFSDSVQYTDWVDIDSATDLINGLYADGGTYYDDAINAAMNYYDLDDEGKFYDNGLNYSFFLSDGEPNYGITSTLENTWENFLIEHNIFSDALGFGGLDYDDIEYLNPIAFDGTKVEEPADDHSTGEKDASITIDVNNLEDALLEQARVDFVENVIGTSGDDTITGNSLDNIIKGGAGNDIMQGGVGNDTIIGGDGDADMAVFSGNSDQYNFSSVGGNLIVSVADGENLKDGTDTIYSSTEYLVFNNISMKFTDLYAAAESGFDNTNPIKELAVFASAAYESSTYRESLSDTWAFMNLDSNGELSLAANADSMFTNENVAALIAVHGDSLVLSFRGTDSIFSATDSDALEWVLQGDHYEKFQDSADNKNLLQAIYDYVSDDSNGIKNVYVTGHSLGGAMVTWYLCDDAIGGNALVNSGVNVYGASFAAPEALDWDVSHDFSLDNRIDYFKIEVAHDPVADVVQILEHFVESAINYVVSKGMSGLAEHGFSKLSELVADYSTNFVKYYNATMAFLKDAYPDIVTGSTFLEKLIGNLTTYIASMVDSLDVNSLITANNIIGDDAGTHINVDALTFNSLLADIPLLGLYYQVKLHGMDESYLAQIEKMDEVGFTHDLDFITHYTNIGGVEGEVDTYDPVKLSDYGEIVGDVPSMDHLIEDMQSAIGFITSILPFPFADEIGGINNLIDMDREYFSAERYTDNQILIGTNNSDILIGDAVGSSNGSDDIFYVGGGSDDVYGHQKNPFSDTAYDDDGGTDTVVYQFENTYIFKGNLNHGNMTGDFNHEIDSILNLGGTNKVVLNVDGTPDNLWDIEQLHFVDKGVNADYANHEFIGNDSTNFIVGSETGDVIYDNGGNDYVYGGAGSDEFYMGEGSDRVHGGSGIDMAFYDGNINDYSIYVQNSTLIVNDNDGNVDALYSVESLSFGGQSLIDTSFFVIWGNQAYENTLSNTGYVYETLLEMYAPVVGYSDGDYDDYMTMYGNVNYAPDNSISLFYTITEDDTSWNVLDTDEAWTFEIRLDDSYLPSAYIAYQNDNINEIQVRNPFDTSIMHIDNHPVFFVEDENDNPFLTFYEDYGSSDTIADSIADIGGWLYTSDVDMKNVSAVYGDGTTVRLYTSGDSLSNHSYLDEYDADFDDMYINNLDNSLLYEVADAESSQNELPYKLAGIDNGDMAMGMLFDDTKLANLGHYDIV